MFYEPQLTALADAACAGNVVRIKQYISSGIDINGEGKAGVTPLYFAVACKSHAGIEALLELGADPNHRLKDGIGNTSVLAATWSDDPEILRTLLKHGGDRNAEFPNNGPSALVAAYHYALLTDRWENYYSLLDAGTDINKESGGRTIVDWMVGRYDKIAELLDRGYNHNLSRIVLNIQHEERLAEKLTLSSVLWRDRVKTILEKRGVRFPVSDPSRDQNQNKSLQ
jgi:hypothetical protein